MTLVAAADGSSLGNPGPGGWAWYIDDDRWASGGWARATNNQGELTAVIELLDAASDEPELKILLDSQYVLKSATEWIPGWKRRGWRKSDGKPVQNAELMQTLDALLEARRAAGHSTNFEWVRGHAGHELNERADKLAQAAARAYQAGGEPEAGPGLGTGPRSAQSAEPETTHASEAHSAQADAPADLFDGFGFSFEESSQDEIVRLEQRLLSDEVRSDPASVAALLHPEWEEIGASGRRWSRDEMLAQIAPLSQPVTLEVLETHEISTSAVLLVWRSVGETTALRSSLWVKNGEQWRQRFHQGTKEQ